MGTCCMLLGTQIFQRPISPSADGKGDHKVVKIDWPATDHD